MPKVNHRRMKERHTKPNAEQQRYWKSLIPQCVVCGDCEVVPHHILASCPGKARRRDHWFVVMLCPLHHNMGTNSVHLLGSEALFLKVHGIDLVAIAARNLRRWRAA